MGPVLSTRLLDTGSSIEFVRLSAPLTAETTGVRQLISLAAGDLSAQPIGEKKFFVVVEATLDSGEEMRVGTPFVRQE